MINFHYKVHDQTYEISFKTGAYEMRDINNLVANVLATRGGTLNNIKITIDQATGNCKIILT